MTRRSLAAAVILLAVATPVAAGEPTDRLRTLFERANGVLVAPDSESSFDDRLASVRALVTDVFDVEGAAALALGRHWQPLPAPARAAFTRLYADVVERGYLAWVGARARVGEGGVSVRWVAERVEGELATVESVLLARNGTEVPIDYRMVRRAGAWLVRDVVVDGVSLAANYHVQFERVMQLGSYEELLARLGEKAGPAARAAVASMGASAPPAIVAHVQESPPVVVRDVPAPVVAQHVATARADTPVVAQMPIAAPAPTITPEAASSSTAVATAVSKPVAVDSRPPARTVATSTPPVRRPAFWVQVGAFRTLDAATDAVQRLRQYAVTIAVGGDRRAPLTRVLVGPFAEHAAAAEIMRTLRARGMAAFIAASPD